MGRKGCWTRRGGLCRLTLAAETARCDSSRSTWSRLSRRDALSEWRGLQRTCLGGLWRSWLAGFQDSWLVGRAGPENEPGIPCALSCWARHVYASALWEWSKQCGPLRCWWCRPHHWVKMEFRFEPTVLHSGVFWTISLDNEKSLSIRWPQIHQFEWPKGKERSSKTVNKSNRFWNKLWEWLKRTFGWRKMNHILVWAWVFLLHRPFSGF